MMRQIVYANWTTEMLKSRLHDLRRMKDNRWNSEVAAVKREIVEEIVKVQMDWMDDAKARYPKTAGMLQGLFGSEELLAYSDETLDLYGRFIAQLCGEGKNLAELTMQNLALLCGSGSLDQFEKNL